MTNPANIYIVAVGARTPLGLTAPTAAAAVRAEITALAEHPFMVDQLGDPMPGALDPELDPQLIMVSRLLAMAETALREVCSPLDCELSLHAPLPVFLGLPEMRPGFTEMEAESVRLGLGKLEGLPIPFSEIHIFAQGHSAGFAAMAAATEAMRQGEIEACFVGGLESYFNPDTMEWLDANRQLAGAASRSGFVPGEGAGFCLLMTERACARLKLKAFVRVHAITMGCETKLLKSSDICLGEGLTATVRDALSCLHSLDGRINSIICDINGERYRSEEWGFVCLHLGTHFDNPTGYLSPAEYWGDMGAASGPLFAMLFLQANARGYSKGSRTLMWASSEGGQRGCVVLETST